MSTTGASIPQLSPQFDVDDELRAGGVLLCCVRPIGRGGYQMWRLFNFTSVTWDRLYFPTKEKAREAGLQVAKLWWYTLLRDAGGVDGE